MLTQSNHTRRSGGYLGRAMALPLLLVLFSAFALRPVHRYTDTLRHTGAPITVIIDAGHGGIDPGAQVNNFVEKDIVLALAQKVNELAPQYNVRVVLTRNSDALPGNATDIHQALKKRVEITAQEKAALFVSLHVNFSDKENASEHAGFEAYIAGRGNGEKGNPHASALDRGEDKNRLLASTLLQQLAPLYTTAPAISQRSEQGIWVLDHNVCPAVLLECGNLSVPADVAFITDKDNQEKIARGILEGIVRFSK